MPAWCLVLVAALLFSTGGAAMKLVDGLDAWQVAFLRSGVAALLLLASVPSARRLPDLRMTAVSMCFALTLVVFVLANRLTTAANAIFLQSTAPLWVVLLAPMGLREPRRGSDLPVVGMLLGGLALLVWSEEVPTSLATHPALGDALSVCCGFTWALTVMGMRWSAREGGSGAVGVAAWGSVLAAGVAAPFAFPMVAAPAADWAVIGWLGVFQVGLAYVLLARGLPQLGALEAMLLLMAEPVLVPVWAYLLHGERPSWVACLGGAIVLAGVGLRAVLAASNASTRRA